MKKQKNRRKRKIYSAVYAGVFFVFVVLGLLMKRSAVGVISFGVAAAALFYAVNTWFRLVKKTMRDLIGIALVAASVACMVLFFAGVGGRLFPVQTDRLDTAALSGVDSLEGVSRLKNLARVELRDSGLTGLEYLSGCPVLAYADLRGNEISVQQAAALQQALPDCEFLWDVTLSSGKASQDVQSLVLTAEDVQSIEDAHAVLALFPALTQVDMTAVTLDVQSFALLEERYPQIQFSWNTRLGGETIESEATELTIREWVAVDVLSATLSNLERVEILDLSTVEYTPEELQSISEQFPDLTIYWRTSIGGAQVTSSDTELNLTGRGVDWNTLVWLAENAHSLTGISLYDETLTREQAVEFARQYPGIRLYRDVKLNGETLDRETQSLDLSEQTLVFEEIAADLSALPALQRVDLTGCSLTEAEKRALSDRLPGVECVWVMDLFGYQVSTDSEKLKVVDAKIGSADELIQALKYFPKLRYIDLTNCTLSNEDLDAVRTLYPEKGIVWTVHVGIYSIRTDATAFSTFHVTGKEPYYYSEDFQVLRYCNEMLALDIGHNHVKDLTWLEDMPQLKVLILVDNNISDISSLAALTNLEYLELFVNTVTDISPLAGLDKLIDLNLGFNNFSDVEPLTGLTGLERLWLTNNFISYKDQLRLQEALPNTRIDFTAKTAVEGGWRVHERYNIIFEMFKNGYYIDWEWNVKK